MRLRLFIFALLSCAAYADNDITGNAVVWSGQITQQYREGDNTCFELNRRNAMPAKFKTCVYGYYDATQYGMGKWLKVTGLLQIDTSPPMITAAQISLTDAPLPPHRYRPDYGYPRYNPYDPFNHYY